MARLSAGGKALKCAVVSMLGLILLDTRPVVAAKPARLPEQCQRRVAAASAI
jgi:hypothetical protein